MHHVAAVVVEASGVTYTRLLHEDGISREVVGDRLAILGAIFEHPIAAKALRGPVTDNLVVITRSPALDGAAINAVFNGVSVSSPYDDWTTGLYRDACNMDNNLHLHLPVVTIATDGSVRKNGSAAGAWVCESDGDLTFDAWPMRGATINEVETEAIWRALNACLPRTVHKVKVLSDSKRAIAVTQNRISSLDDCPKSLRTRIEKHLGRNALDIEWVKSHNGNKLNVLADQLARNASIMVKKRERVSGDSPALRTILQRLHENLSD